MTRRLWIEGADGSIWNLAGPGAGTEGAMMMPGPSKLIDAPAKTFWVQGATQMHYQGRQFERRDPTFSIGIHDPDRYVWSDVDSRFRMALGMYDEQFTIGVESEYGIRRLDMRLLQEPTAYANNPAEKAWEFGETTLNISAACSNPFWYGAPIPLSWTSTTGAGSGTLNAKNLGDVPVWPKYFVNAPGTWTLPDFSWGQDLYFMYGPPLISRAVADAARTQFLPALNAGEDTSVDTDPNVETLIAANGALVQARWEGNGLLYPIAPHTPATAVPVSLAGGNPGAAVTMTIPQWFSRPWGVMR
ncbi:hypothetical protein ACFXG4_27120 [Nocardia sp. NPDC059246]|uniref:hypothetical protein n=1 Tax=unclassified Nocardia TaxID=2637762 RepID=UPI0036CA3B58